MTEELKKYIEGQCREVYHLGRDRGRAEVRKMVITIVGGSVAGQLTSAENYALRLAVMAKRERQHWATETGWRFERKSLENAIQSLQEAHDANMAALRQEFESERSERVSLARLNVRLQRRIDKLTKKGKRAKKS